MNIACWTCGTTEEDTTARVTCTKCNVAVYCTVECQDADWQHDASCEALGLAQTLQVDMESPEVYNVGAWCKSSKSLRKVLARLNKPAEEEKEEKEQHQVGLGKLLPLDIIHICVALATLGGPEVVSAGTVSNENPRFYVHGAPMEKMAARVRQYIRQITAPTPQHTASRFCPSMYVFQLPGTPANLWFAKNTKSVFLAAPMEWFTSQLTAWLSILRNEHQEKGGFEVVAYYDALHKSVHRYGWSIVQCTASGSLVNVAQWSGSDYRYGPLTNTRKSSSSASSAMELDDCSSRATVPPTEGSVVILTDIESDDLSALKLARDARLPISAVYVHTHPYIARSVSRQLRLCVGPNATLYFEPASGAFATMHNKFAVMSVVDSLPADKRKAAAFPTQEELHSLGASDIDALLTPIIDGYNLDAYATCTSARLLAHKMTHATDVLIMCALTSTMVEALLLVPADAPMRLHMYAGNNMLRTLKWHADPADRDRVLSALFSRDIRFAYRWVLPEKAHKVHTKRDSFVALCAGAAGGVLTPFKGTLLQDQWTFDFMRSSDREYDLKYTQILLAKLAAVHPLRAWLDQRMDWLADPKSTPMPTIADCPIHEERDITEIEQLIPKRAATLLYIWERGPGLIVADQLLIAGCVQGSFVDSHVKPVAVEECTTVEFWKQTIGTTVEAAKEMAVYMTAYAENHDVRISALKPDAY